jgi:hypothetical protein
LEVKNLASRPELFVSRQIKESASQPSEYTQLPDNR